MYLLYVDESGQTTIKQNRQNNGLYIQSGILVHEKDWRMLEEKLVRMKQEIFPNLRPHEWELHAHDIWNSRVSLKKLELYTEKKKEIFSRIVDNACESKITIINVIIFKDMLKNMQNASSEVMRQSWLRLTERFESFLKQKRVPADNGLFFIDASSRRPDCEIRNTIHSIVRKGGMRRGIQHVIEDPIFVESRMRNLIQLADMVAYVVHKHYTNNPMFDKWFQSLVPKMYHHNGKLHGFGIVEFPRKSH